MNAVGCAALFAGAGLHVSSGTSSGIAAFTVACGRMSTLKNPATLTCGSTAPMARMKATANGTGEALLSSEITIQRTPLLCHRQGGRKHQRK